MTHPGLALTVIQGQSVSTLLYHWSPRRNRDSIIANGLTPGNLSNSGDWNPPHICLAETPEVALGLCHGEPPLDLWQVRATDCIDLFPVEREWRTRHPVQATAQTEEIPQ